MIILVGVKGLSKFKQQPWIYSFQNYQNIIHVRNNDFWRKIIKRTFSGKLDFKEDILKAYRNSIMWDYQHEIIKDKVYYTNN